MAAAEEQSAANDGKLPNHFRHRLIASKPLFILAALRASALPVAWMDVDLEFHQFPELFQPAAPATWLGLGLGFGLGLGLGLTLTLTLTCGASRRR